MWILVLAVMISGPFAKDVATSITQIHFRSGAVCEKAAAVLMSSNRYRGDITYHILAICVDSGFEATQGSN